VAAVTTRTQHLLVVVLIAASVLEFAALAHIVRMAQHFLLSAKGPLIYRQTRQSSIISFWSES
jgi:hypothetical protein